MPYFSMGQDRLPPNTGDLYEWAENKGQWDSDILFRSQQNALDLQIGSDFIAYYFYNPQQMALLNKHSHAQTSEPIPNHIDVYPLRFQFVKASGGKPVLNAPKTHYLNFYQGNNPAHWANEVRVSNEVGIESLYKGINLQVHSAANKLKYEFWLEPNVRLSDICIELKGAKNIYTEYGDLYIETPFATLREQKPFAYQFINGKQVQVQISFAVKDNILHFESGSDYDSKYPLVIDPEMIFLTYSGSTVDNFGCTATHGEKGTMYTAGVSTGPYAINPTGTYPVTPGAFQLTFAGGGISEGELYNFPCDITFSKYKADGTSLLHASYLGGSNNEVPHSLVVDDSNNLVIMGSTYSKNFPVSKYAFDTSQNGRTDFIISKFSSSGKMIASTFVGGSENDAINFTKGITNYFYGDSYRGDVIVDSLGEVLVASVSQSPNFPTSTGCFQNALKGFQDGVVFALSPDLSKMKWSTYIGGDSIDAFYSIDIGKQNQVYLSGGSRSPNFPGTAGTYQSAYAGGQTDGIIAILSNSGKTLQTATYFGTNTYDQIYSLDLDKDNLIYVVGQSLGSIPVSPNVYNNPGSHQFLACFSSDLKTKVWSTVFGSGRANIDLTINAFLVDDCKRIYISSWGGTESSKFGSSTNGMPVTPDAFQISTDGSDFYLLLLNKNASGLLYATFIGGDDPLNAGDHVDGGTSRYDKTGVVYQSMCASCPQGIPPTPLSDLHTTPNAFAPVNKSPRCSNAALKFDFRINNAAFNWTVDTCSSTFSFFNKTKNGSNFFWTFPDGDTSYKENPIKQITSNYYGKPIMLIVEFGTNCADTAYGSVSLPSNLDKIKIPNVFTPNGDGKNDYYKIEGVSSQCDETEVYIYNRWGQLYFEDHVSYFEWDGKNKNGEEAPEGVYFFILKNHKTNTDQSSEYHGTITLIR